MRRLHLILKRIFDIFASALALLLFTVIPVMIVIPIVIRLTSPGPAIFRQTRIGRGGAPFVMYKFRTMISEQYTADGQEIMSENRITPVGRFLRKTSLDELPQLINVLRGDMSIVGPRPMLDYQAPRCIGEERLRFDMAPGLTGLAQVRGRNDIRWEERIVHDIEYVKTFSVFLDLSILCRTVLLVLRPRGTDVRPQYRGVSRFSRDYVPEAAENSGAVKGTEGETV